MDEVLRNIKDFENAIDEVQESQEDHYNDDELEHLASLRALKIWIEEYKKQSLALNQNLNQLQADFIDFNLAACAGSNEIWIKMQSTVNKWNEIAKEGRVKGNKSLLELVTLDQSQQGLETLNSIKISTIVLGNWLSRIILRYILLFEWSEPVVMQKVIHLVRETIRSRSLAKNSIVNCGFTFVVELIRNGMTNLQMNRKHMKQKTVEKVSFGKRENDLLNLILFDVFYFETTLYCPFFPMVSSNNGLRLFGNNVRQSFEPKLKKLSSQIDEYAMRFGSVHDEGTKKLVKMLDVEIKKVWNKLDV